jgi:modulator of drug activity B
LHLRCRLEIENHLWADVIILQTPVNWMGVPWTFKKYMISLTFNAPHDSFNGPDQLFFEGRGVDDLFWPTHLSFRFFGMEALETFACYDVMENPDIEGDFERFKAHLDRLFPR